MLVGTHTHCHRYGFSADVGVGTARVTCGLPVLCPSRERVDLASFRRGVRGELDSMVPRLGPGQFIEGVLGKYQVEVTEVRRDVLFVIHGLGVLSESLHKPLGNHSGHADVFCLGEESGCPDSVAIFKGFIREVGFRVGRLLGCRLGFIFLVGIFYEGWEGASPAGIYPFGVLPLCVPFQSA